VGDAAPSEAGRHRYQKPRLTTRAPQTNIHGVQRELFMFRKQIGNPLPSAWRFEEDRPTVAPAGVVHLIVILDRSLSMAGQEEQVSEALRAFIDTLKNAPNQPDYAATLVEFADHPDTILLRQPLEKLAIHYKADGEGTALWDAMACAFLLEKSRQDRIICVIVSDGEENCSREADQEQIAAMVRSRMEWGNWSFVWLNLQGKPSKNAKALGIRCFDSTRDQIAKSLPAVAREVSRVAARLAGGSRGLLLEGGRR
jgi:hypothetical protein